MKVRITRPFHGIVENKDFSEGEVLTTTDCTEDRMNLFMKNGAAELIEEVKKKKAAEKPKRTRKKKGE